MTDFHLHKQIIVKYARNSFLKDAMILGVTYPIFRVVPIYQLDIGRKYDSVTHCLKTQIMETGWLTCWRGFGWELFRHMQNEWVEKYFDSHFKTFETRIKRMQESKDESKKKQASKLTFIKDLGIFDAFRMMANMTLTHPFTILIQWT